MATKDVLKQGYLNRAPEPKHLLNIKKWQRKWYALHHNGDLFCYDSEKSSKVIQKIPLLQCYRVFDARTKGLDLNYCVGLEIEKDTFYIKAETASDYNHWVPLIAGFAEVVDAPRTLTSSGLPTTERRPTMTSDLQADEEEERYRSSSVDSRHLSLETKARFNQKSGWLAKTGPKDGNKGWKDRYFILSHGKLSYFKSEKADSPLGAIDIFECTSVAGSVGKKGHGFKIETSSRTYNLSTETLAEMVEWMEAIKQSMSVISELKGPVRSFTVTGTSSEDSQFSPSPKPHPYPSPPSPKPHLSAPSPSPKPHPSPRSPSPKPHLSTPSPSPKSQPSHRPASPKPRPSPASSPKLRPSQQSVSPSPKISQRSLSPSSQDTSTSASATERLSLGASSQGGEKDSHVLQLLEVEVEALRVKVTHLDSDLCASREASAQLQQELAAAQGWSGGEGRRLAREKEELQTQLSQQQRRRVELETVNDSLQTQLEGHVERLQLVEEEEAGLRHELEETQGALVAMEEDSRALQQELADTQHKLQDIQCVAKDLELALAKREYESSNDHTSSSDHAPSSNEPLVDEDMATEPGEHERDLTSDKRIQFSPRSRYLRRTVGAGAPRARSETELHGSSASRHQLDEERLKWQMEMANLRRECSQVEIERDEFLRERSKLKEKAASFEQKYETLRREVEGKDAEQGRNLVEARDRVSNLEAELSSCLERLAQLQVEKEKAVADLINIRRLNKKLCETEAVSTSPSPFSNGLRPQASDVEVGEQFQSEAQLEREQLLTDAEGLQDGVRDVDEASLPNASKFTFNSKAMPTIASSSKTSSVHSSHRGQSFHDSLRQHNLHSGQDRNDTPPPKPQRPPPQLLSHYNPQPPPAARSRAGTLMQSLFGLN